MTESAPLPRRAFSAREVGEQINVPYETVLAAIHDGQIAAFKVGRRYCVPDFELERLLQSAKRETAS